MIRAVIFDYGNVISEDKTSWSSSEMERLSGVPSSVFLSVYQKIRKEFDRGTITGIEMYRQLLNSFNYHHKAQDNQLLQLLTDLDMKGWSTIRQDVTDWGLSLKEKGFKLGILSNMPSEFLTQYGSTIEMFKQADYACFSCNLHLIKPDPAIYNECLKRLNVSPAESVFFDDLEVNVEAAKKIGIHAYRYTSLQQAKKDFDSIILQKN